MSAVLDVVGLGRMAYDEALQLQRTLAARRIRGELTHDLLLLVEHPPVITLGRGSRERHVLEAQSELARRGVGLYDVERGGDVTFHGPGQLVGYTIFDLREHEPDLHRYLRRIESSLMHALGTFGLDPCRHQGLTGVWIEHRKIASIGIHVKQWITWHGFALNVTTDLSYFDLIVPCGIHNVQMTSIRNELGERTPSGVWGQAADAVVFGFAEEFAQQPQAVRLEELHAKPAARTPPTDQSPHDPR